MEFYFLNTSEESAPGQYTVWLENNMGFEHATEDERKDIAKLSPGDCCLMYISQGYGAKHPGVKAVGEVLEHWDEKPHLLPMINRSRRPIRPEQREFRIRINWHLVLPQSITHNELAAKYGLPPPRGTARPVCKNRDKVAKLVLKLKEENARFPEEVDETEVVERYRENHLRQTTVNAHERNADARIACIKHHGCMCVVCGFNFETVYGEVGRGFIHVHHLTPLSQIHGEYNVDPIEDLKPVCPNCHAVIHRRTPPFTIDEIKELVNGSQ